MGSEIARELAALRRPKPGNCAVCGQPFVALARRRYCDDPACRRIVKRDWWRAHRGKGAGTPEAAG